MQGAFASLRQEISPLPPDVAPGNTGPPHSGIRQLDTSTAGCHESVSKLINFNRGVPGIALRQQLQAVGDSSWRSADRRHVALPFITGRVGASHGDIPTECSCRGQCPVPSGRNCPQKKGFDGVVLIKAAAENTANGMNRYCPLQPCVMLISLRLVSPPPANSPSGLRQCRGLLLHFAKRYHPSRPMLPRATPVHPIAAFVNWIQAQQDVMNRYSN